MNGVVRPVSGIDTPWPALLVAGALFVVIRPLATWLLLRTTRTTRAQRWVLGWFGIRGIGSLFYVAYALNHGLSGSAAVASPEHASTTSSAALRRRVTSWVSRVGRRSAGADAGRAGQNALDRRGTRDQRGGEEQRAEKDAEARERAPGKRSRARVHRGATEQQPISAGA